ncbi:uncharacterized protein LOC108035648 [Drosophila biarmipes]|uniref:uncharacterized protein LOC108035648 n=1 Tax=Drosophila biarmipes TaxID=125945 RepID=UPI0007E7A4CB|nr:uncharacterized protein LOC108035648 [Drosophila biarmipes]
MEDLVKMCRVCMGEAEELLGIYDNKSFADGLSAELKKTKEPEPTPADLMRSCSSVPVSSGDCFPLKICEPCLRKLRDALLFKMRYAKNVACLRRVKSEKKDQETCDLLEAEDWSLVDRIKDEDEEEDENKNDLQPSAKKVKEEKPRPFKCPDCPKSFTGKAQLTMHSRTHTKGKGKRRSVK